MGKSAEVKRALGPLAGERDILADAHDKVLAAISEFLAHQRFGVQLSMLPADEQEKLAIDTADRCAAWHLDAARRAAHRSGIDQLDDLIAAQYEIYTRLSAVEDMLIEADTARQGTLH